MSRSAPNVAAVMLVNGRPEMVARAIASFRAQTYKNAHLIIFDTGTKPAVPLRKFAQFLNVYLIERPGGLVCSFGALRNAANGITLPSFDAICHWDSDDWSHPRRIEEQVSLMENTGSDLVGYNDMLFWDTRPGAFSGAWRYSTMRPDYVLDTSAMYWRHVWEKHPFPDVERGADVRWLLNLAAARVPIVAISAVPSSASNVHCAADGQPRMIAQIHGSNTSTAYREEAMKAKEWVRVPEWDEHCKKVMAL